MSDQANKPMSQEKIQMKTKKESKKRKHSPNSTPVEVSLPDVGIYELSGSTPLDQKETDEEMSPQRKAALEYLDKAREAVSAIKAQAAEKNFDLMSVFPFMELPFMEFPFMETPVKPEESEANVTFVSQGQQTELDDIESGIAKLEIKGETPVKDEPKVAAVSQDQQGKQDQQGEDGNSDNVFAQIKTQTEIPVTTEQFELGVGSVIQAQQEQGEEAQENVIITPLAETEPSEL